MSNRRLEIRIAIVALMLAMATMAPRAAAQSSSLSPPPAAPLPPETLAKMYAAELGPLYHSADLPRLYSLHGLIERFFAANSGPQRNQIVADIDALGFDRPVIGRLARLRMDWQPLAPGVYYINDKVGPHDVRYFLGIPRGYDLTRSWPLVVKLPAANAFLTQPPPDSKQVTTIYTQWIEDELSDHPDALVLMPLLNLDELYGPGPVGMNLVMQPIFHAAGKANIDPSRVYLIGHSIAAHAVWNLAIHYPTYFAAINPMAGSVRSGWQRYRLPNLRNILCVVWHDANDNVVSVNESRDAVHYLDKLKYPVDYLETQNIGHAPDAQIVEEEYAKLRAWRRDLYPSEVVIQSNSPDTLFNRADWVQIYQPLSPGEQVRMTFARGSQGMYLYQNGFHVLAGISAPNTITLATSNVQILRLYLNDQMADLSKPIKVIVNGKTRFDALATQSTDEMLKDQLFFGRGWRYYTAIIDLDLAAPPTTVPTTRPAQTGGIEYITPEGEHKVFYPH